MTLYTKPKYQKCLDDYELRDYNIPMFDKMPPVGEIRERSEQLLGIDISTLIEREGRKIKSPFPL